MGFIKNILFVFGILMFFQNTMAIEWGEYAKVEEIYVKTDGASPYIQFGIESNMKGCYKDSGGYLKGVDIDHALSVILAAKMASRQVRPLYDVIQGNSGWSQCHIKSVFIK